jgi:hypothetical protein
MPRLVLGERYGVGFRGGPPCRLFAFFNNYFGLWTCIRDLTRTRMFLHVVVDWRFKVQRNSIDRSANLISVVPSSFVLGLLCLDYYDRYKVGPLVRKKILSELYLPILTEGRRPR